MSIRSALRVSTGCFPAQLFARPWLLSLAVGLATILSVFPIPVLLGTAPFWDNPRGIVGGSVVDMAAAQSGYYAYVHDTWRWPLFLAAGLGPDGVNVLFTDSVPIVALLGRLLYSWTGHVVPLYGYWSGLCIGGMALASTGLIRALGVRSPTAAAAAAVVGVSMPAFLARWGHLSLMAQALIPLALVMYFRMSRAARLRTGAVLGQCLALSLVSLLIHPYLYLMVTGIAAAAVLQAGTDRRLPRLQAVAVLSAMATATVCTMVAVGYGGSAVSASDEGFGVYSANLLSLLVPYSGDLLGHVSYTIDGTGGQYEGMAFLGAGVLILAMLGRREIRPAMTAARRRHPWLLAFVAGCMTIAVSDQVYVGTVHVLSVPLPSPVAWAAGVVRASGRFVWVAMYLLAALAIAAAARRRDATLILSLAAAVQWAGAAPLRHAIHDKVAGRPVSALDRAAWQAVLPGVDQLVAEPPVACLPEGPWWTRRMVTAVHLQLLAAEAGVPTNTLYAARTAPDCRVPPLTPRSILVRLDSAPPVAGLNCIRKPIGSVCSAGLGPAELAGLLPDGELESFR